ncbi:MAG: hypothetical protein HYX78_11715 [Armatimonadetes bacterium]|nr:hypothetical protein [Armatimonadota bacterium]
MFDCSLRSNTYRMLTLACLMLAFTLAASVCQAVVININAENPIAGDGYYISGPYGGSTTDALTLMDNVVSNYASYSFAVSQAGTYTLRLMYWDNTAPELPRSDSPREDFRWRIGASSYTYWDGYGSYGWNLIYGGQYTLTAGTHTLRVTADSTSTFNSGWVMLDYMTLTLASGQQVNTIHDAKAAEDDTPVDISGAIVTAAFSNFFYIEAEDRSCGIRVDKSEHGLSAGTKVRVAGIMATSSSSERYIAASSASNVGNGSVDPVAMNNRSLGGGDFSYVPGPPARGQKGVAGGVGTNNIGLLITTWGRASLISGMRYSLSDGSGVEVILEMPGGMSIPEGSHVVVTGISSCEREPTSGDLKRLIRVTNVRGDDSISWSLYEDYFDSGGLNGAWLGNRGSVTISGGVATCTGSIYVPLNVAFTDCVLEFRAKFSRNTASNNQEWVRLLNTASDARGQQGIGVNAHKANIPFHYDLYGLAPFLSPDIWGWNNDENFHTYRVEFIGGVLSWYQDDVLIVEVADVSADSTLWQKLEVMGYPDRPIQLDWIKLWAPNEQTAWPARPIFAERQAFWSSHIDEMWTRIDNQKQNINWQTHPVYGAQITEASGSVTVVRPTVQLQFSASNCSITQCQLRNQVFSGLALPDLIMTDTIGREYHQRYAVNGSLTTNDSLEKATITGTFTPRTSGGTSAPVSVQVVYDLRKVSGMLLIDYTVSPNPPGSNPTFRRMTVAAGLGSASQNLDAVRVPGYWDVFTGAFMNETVQMDVSSTANSVYFNGPADYATWTDGKVGFQLVHGGIAMKQLPVTEGARNDASQMKFITAEARNGERLVSMTPWNQGATGSKVLDQPFAISVGLGLMPSREFKPKYGTVWDRTVSLPFYVDHHAWSGRTEEMMRQNAQLGVDLATISIGMYSQVIYQPTIYRRFVDNLHKYGMTTLYYTEGTGIPTHDVVTDGMLTEEQYQNALFTCPPDAPGPHANLVIGDLNAPEFRLLQMATLYNCLKNYDVDGMYVDSFFFEAIPGGPSRLKGATDFAEEVRLLMDSFPEPKYFLGHNHVDVSPAIQGVTDFTYPGEHRMGANLPELPLIEQILPYNSLMAGAQVIPLDLGTYNLESSTIFHQFYSGCVGGVVNYWPWMQADKDAGSGGIYRDVDQWVTFDFTDQELVNARKFFEPLSVFQAQGAHHPIQSDYGNYVSSYPSGVTAVVYDRSDLNQWMVTVSDDGSATKIEAANPVSGDNYYLSGPYGGHTLDTLTLKDNGSNNYAQYNFNIEDAGTYTLFIDYWDNTPPEQPRDAAPIEDFFWKIDGGAYNGDWNGSFSAGNYGWNLVNGGNYTLTAGTHTLRISANAATYNSGWVMLDYMQLVKAGGGFGGNVTIGLNLDSFPGGTPSDVIVFDCVNKTLVGAQESGNTLTISNLSLDPFPQALLVSPKPQNPSALWNSRTVRTVISQNYNTGTGQLELQLQGIPNCTGQVWVYKPAQGTVVEQTVSFPESGIVSIAVPVP